MDDKLMPPSHFDPNEQDSLDVTPSSVGTYIRCPVSSVVRGGVSNNPTQYYYTPKYPALCRHEDFSSPTVNPGTENAGIHLINIGRRKGFSRPENSPGQYETPAQVTRNGGFSAIPTGNKYQQLQQNVTQNYSELIHLQAENEALKSVIQCKKAKAESQALHHPSKDHCSSAQQAVIEHQTQHIARLQKDLEEQRLAVSKKNAEITQYENAVASKEKDNRKLSGSIELLEARLDAKNGEGTLKDQEIEDLQKMIRKLRMKKDELVHCHSGELSSLKQNFNEETEIRVRDLTATMEKMSARHEEEKVIGEKEVKTIKQQHTLQISQLVGDHQVKKENWEKRVQEVVTTHTNEMKKIDAELNEQRAKSESLLKSLTEAKLENEKLQVTVNELQASLESSQKICEKHLARANQLQVYIGQQQSEDYEKSQWKTHKQQYEETIMALQTEKETMTKTLELQNVRLQSITKILTTQEEAINANSKALSTGKVKGNPSHVVIRRWREKVFELMVQCKSHEITMKSVENGYILVHNDLKEDLEEEKRVTVILENQLSECKAQLEIQQRENGLLFAKSEKFLKKLNETTKNASELEEAIVSMSEQVANSTSELCQRFQDKFTTLAEKTVHLEQRLVFANNRLRTLHDLFVRKENLRRAKRTKDDMTKVVEAPHPQGPETGASLFERLDLVTEIERLTQEKDTLSQKLSGDSATFESCTVQFKERESSLENELGTLQNELQNKSEEIAELKVQLDNIQEKLKDQQRVAEDATENAKVVEENQNTAIEQKVEEARQAYDAEKLDLDKKLEKSQREHARTVVTSRQNERIAIREKKQAVENFEAVAEEHKKENESLQARLKDLQRDNNILMTTLRQQGLVSTFKEARLKAKNEEQNYQSSDSPAASPSKEKLALSTTTFDRDDSSTSLPSDCGGHTPPSGGNHVDNREPDGGNVAGMLKDLVIPGGGSVAEMLKDLVVLTENLLEDSN